MNFNVNIKRKFKINGKEYGSLEEMPPDVRALVEKATNLSSGGGQGITTRTTSKIIFNETEYGSTSEMPAEVRGLYEQAMKAAGMENTTASLPDFPVAARSGEHAPAAESSFSPRSVVVLVLIIGLIGLAYYIFTSHR